VEDLEQQATEAQSEVQRLQAEQEELQRQLPHQGDKWLGLAGTCVDAREPQYTYRGCLFGKAAQIDNNAGHETSLGNWKGFNEDMTKVGGRAGCSSSSSSSSTSLATHPRRTCSICNMQFTRVVGCFMCHHCRQVVS
jgi:hypothetical protein